MNPNRANPPSQHLTGPGFQPGAAAAVASRSVPAISAQTHVKTEPGVAQAAAPFGGGLAAQAMPQMGGGRGVAGPQNSAQMALLLGPHQLSSADRLE